MEDLKERLVANVSTAELERRWKAAREEVERAVANASKISRPLAQKLKDIVFK